MGTPAGSPVKVATRHSPCDSPAVSNRNISQSFYGSKATGVVEEATTPITGLNLWAIDYV